MRIAGTHFCGCDLIISYHTTCAGKPCFFVKHTRLAYGSKVVVDTWIDWPNERQETRSHNCDDAKRIASDTALQPKENDDE